MNINQKYIKVEKNARYFVLGAPSEKIKSVWFVLHGYGQLAEDFIKYFKLAVNESALVVAPEALNRFYLKGFGGKTGATWMTKEEREKEINDYVNYLDSIYDEVIKYGLFTPAKVTVLGFSQGTATACRWIANGKSKVNRLILWGGGIPHDVELRSSEKLLNSIRLEIVVGDKDEFISKDQIKKEINRLEENKINYKLHKFNGGHEIKAEILQQLVNKNKRR